jgi:hypothetical protein
MKQSPPTASRKEIEMSEGTCTCRIKADECDGKHGVFHPFQAGANCTVRACEKTLAHSASIEDWERECDRLRSALVNADDLVGDLIKERDALKVKLAGQPAQQEPVAWGIFYFGGKRNGKMYSQTDSEENAKRYIADLHHSNDADTFRAAPLYTTPPAPAQPDPDELTIAYMSGSHEGKKIGAKEGCNKLAAWMMQRGFATGHGDTMEDLLDELGIEIAELKGNT